MKKFIAIVLVLGLLGVASVAGYVFYLKTQLPHLFTLKDYKPLLMTRVYDRNGTKIGEFAIERRKLVPFKEIPKVVVDAFLAAEDATFYHHGGINVKAIVRAALVDLRAGGKVQGASTITQQVARGLLLNDKKTYSRKIKEMFLAEEMNRRFTKNQILFLYLNQIYLGQDSYGVAMACETYFHKPLKDITLPEAAILAGLPKAPSEMNPVVSPKLAKDRQRYVLGEMLKNHMITRVEEQKALNTPLKIYTQIGFKTPAPYYLSTVKQMLISKLGESAVFGGGLKVYTGLDLPKQLAGEKALRRGLRALDKRQGYRGPLGHEENPNKVIKLLAQARKKLIEKEQPYQILQPDGTVPQLAPLNLTKYQNGKEGLPPYIHIGDFVKAIVIKVDDKWGLVAVRFAEAKGLIGINTMQWARKPDPTVDVFWGQKFVTKPSQVLKKGDIVLVKVVAPTFSSPRIYNQLMALRRREGRRYRLPKDLPNFRDYARVDLEQEPQVQAGLLALDQKTGDIITMVGGYNYAKSKLNRTIQTSRQTGSAFKPIVYSAALDNGFTPATQIVDAPVVFEQKQKIKDGDIDEMVTDRWSPTDDTQHFLGDVLFRDALINSLNVPSVKILKKIGIPLAVDYARRFGIFSPLNHDYTLVLGSSSITLYEMTKVYSELDNLGRRVRPILIDKVVDKNGKTILGTVYMGEKFAAQEKPYKEEFARRRVAYLAYQQALAAGQKPAAALTAAEQAVVAYNTSLAEQNATGAQSAPGSANALAQSSNNTNAANNSANTKATMINPATEPPIFFKDQNQLIKPQTAYVITNLLEGVVKHGTGMGARVLGRPVAGKTGTSNDFVDGWFMGYTPDTTAGVWVGYDQEQSLGRGEVGAHAALPIWVSYMKRIEKGKPVRDFKVPSGIVFANIDDKTGLLATPRSRAVARQAFVAGTQPTTTQNNSGSQIQDFYKQDLSQ